ncbi:MAG: EamA family transporter [Planctomycetia bacterium]
MTILFIAARILANPFSNVLQKGLTGRGASPLFVVFAVHCLLTIAVLPFAPAPSVSASSEFFGAMVVCALLAVSGNVLIVAALKRTDLSILGPVNAYKPIVGLVGAALFLGEIPGMGEAAGVLLVVVGSHLLTGGRSAGGEAGRFFADRGVRLRLAAVAASATEAVVLKHAVELSSPWTTYAAWCWMGAVISGAAWAASKDKRSDAAAFRASPSLFLALTATTGVMQFCTLAVFDGGKVGPTLALFQISALVSVYLGWRVFHEADVVRRSAAAGVMVGGAALIAVCR